MSEELPELRRKIDNIDEQILLLLSGRIGIMEKIGEIKRRKGLLIRDDKREKGKLGIIEQKAKKLGVPSSLVIQLWRVLFKQSEEIEA